MLLSSDHDYNQCCTEGEDLEMLILDEKEFPTLPVTPSDSPAAKKTTTNVKSVKSDSDITGTLSRLDEWQHLEQWFSNFLHQVPPQKIFGFPSTTIMTNIKML